MALPRLPVDLTAPIPNNPFYSPETSYFVGPYYPANITSASGITVQADGNILVTGGGGGGGVSSVTGTVPIQVVNSTTTPVISVLPATTGAAGVVQLNDSTSSTSSTTAATSLAVKNAYDKAAAALPLSGGTMTGVITFAAGQTIPISALPVATTGNLGVVQIGTNIDVAAGVISVKAASTLNPGVVQLNNSLSSNSQTEALTAAQGQALQAQINALAVAGGLTLAGTFNAATSAMLTATANGVSAGFTVGSNLPSPAAGNTDYFVIVTTPGSYSPPGGGGPYTASQGDWFVSNGTTWEFLNVGTDLPIASTGTQGIVELADVTETQTGTSTTLAVTPAGACATYIPYSKYAAKGDLLAGTTSAGNPTVISLGATSGQVLTIDLTAPGGMKWSAAAGSPVATTSANGIITGCVSGTATSLGLSAGGLFPNPACFNTAVGYLAGGGLTTGSYNTIVGCGSLKTSTSEYASTLIGSDVAPFNAGSENVAVGAFSLYTAINATQNIAIGNNTLSGFTSGSENIAIGYAAAGTQTTGNRNVAIGYGVQLPNTTGGCQLAIGFAAGDYWLTGDNTKAIQPGAGIIDKNGSTGTAGQILASDGANALCWANPGAPSDATPIAKGIVFGCTTTQYTSLGHSALGTGVGTSESTGIGIGALGSTCSGATSNTALGFSSMAAHLCGCFNVAVGNCTLLWGVCPALSTAVGANALANACCDFNTAIGAFSGGVVNSGRANTFLGAFAGGNVTTGCGNVYIGSCIQPANAADNYTMAIGTYVIPFNAKCCWLSGTCNFAIRPGGGIIDCTGSCGSGGQALLSTGGNGVCWGRPDTVDIPCACIVGKGSLITGTTANTPAPLPIGQPGQVLTVDSSPVTGLGWSNTITGICSGSYYRQTAATTTAALDWNTTAYKTISVNSGVTISFLNAPPTNAVGMMTVQIAMGATGAITWPSAVKWPSTTAPSLTTGKTHLIMLSTQDNGTTILGSYLTDYTV